ncbi:MAG: bifunctional phosphoglucose/phosphomannose isomerase [Candidatus Hodarchaeota archaeon]
MTFSIDLDNPETIRSIDKAYQLEDEYNWAEFIDDALKRAEKAKISSHKLDFSKEIVNIVICGMGGSAISGDFLIEWGRKRVSIPIFVNRRYDIPQFVGKNTLVICNSYSGNTEETLSCFVEALKKGSLIIAITSGGKLKDFSERFDIPYILIKGGLQPRASLPYLFVPLLVILKKLSIINNFEEELMDLKTTLIALREKLKPSSPTTENIAKKIALKIGTDSIPIILGSASCVVKRIRCEINENSKLIAIDDEFSELNHNHAVSYEGSLEILKNFTVLLLHNQTDIEPIKTRMDITRNEMLEGKVKDIVTIEAQGNSDMARLISSAYIGDFISIYLAILYKIDPSPVESIDMLKKQLRNKIGLVDKLEKQFVNFT